MKRINSEYIMRTTLRTSLRTGISHIPMLRIPSCSLVAMISSSVVSSELRTKTTIAAFVGTE